MVVRGLVEVSINRRSKRSLFISVQNSKDQNESFKQGRVSEDTGN